MGKAVKVVAGYALMFIGIFAPLPLNVKLGLIKFGQLLIVSGALDIVSQALAPKPTRATRNTQDVEYFGTVEPRRIIYGTNRVSGMNVIPPWTSGTSNANLHQVLALAGHEITAVASAGTGGSVYFDQVEITSGNITAVGGNANDGKVTAGAYANKAWARGYLGTTTQASDYILTDAMAPWTSAHQGKGVAYLALTFVYDETIYKTGKPEVSCIVKGAKCYDPRLDVTPGASPTNAAYIAFTSNPALCLSHYLMHATVGLGESAARIDWDAVVAAANICDEDVVVPPAASPSNKQNRYTCNVVMEVATDDAGRRENIKTLAGAMMGHCVYSQGKWKMYAGAAGAAAFSLTDDDVVGKMTFRTETPASEKYNYVRGQFIDPDRNWQLSEFEPRSSSAYEATDGDRKPREVVFLACTNQYEAQRNAIIVQKRSRLKRQVTLELGMSAFRIRPWEVGTLTLTEMGWTNQDVRCLSWGFSPAGSIEVTFIEEDSTCWNDPAVGDYTVPTVEANLTPGGFTPAAPTDFTTGGLSGGIAFAWTAASTTPASTTFNIYEHTASTPFASATAILTGLTGRVAVAAKGDTTTRYYWVTAVDPFSGLESLPFSGSSPAAQGLSGAAQTAGGGNSVTGFLTNDSHVLPADNDGTITSYTGAGGTFKIFDGLTDVTGTSTTYSEVADPQALTPNPSINSSTGVYAVTGDFDAGEDVATITYRCVYSGVSPSVTIDKIFSLGKSKTGSTGLTGSSGYNAATLTAYKRSSSSPGDNPGTLTYTFATAGWTPGNSWSKTIPAADGNPAWAVSATAYGTDTTDQIDSGNWSSPVQVFANGTAGLNVATAYIYKRTPTDSAPALPSVTATYNFSTGDIADLNNGWSDTIPAVSGSPENRFLWVSLATPSSTGATDTITSGEWTAAQHLAREGADGSDGADGAPGASQYELISHGTYTMTISGSSATKTTGGGNWDTGVYSKESYVNGAFCSAGVSSTTCYIMFGLNSDPTADATYNSIDFAWYFDNAAAKCWVFESASSKYDGGSFTTSTILSIHYDGKNIRYYKDGTLAYTSTVTGSGKKLYFDSSFATVDVALRGIAFGPAGTSGHDGLTFVLSNDSHTIPTDSAGNNGDYTGSGTTISVYEGATALVYDGVGTSSSTWTIGTPSVSNITAGTISDSGSYATVGAHSAMTANTAYVDYPLSGKRANGDAFSVTKRQSFSKAKSGAGGGTVNDVGLSSLSINSGDGGTTTHGFQIHSDGTVDATTVTSGVYTNQYTWMNTGPNTLYECKLVKTGGLPLTSGTLDTWLACSTTRTWYRTASSGTFYGTVYLRRADSGVLLEFAEIEIDNSAV